MKQLNTIPIENFLEKSRIAQKSGAKVVNLSAEESQALADCLAVIMTRLTGELDRVLQQVSQPQDTQVSMDGGNF
jgi:hypothetical protein